MHGCERGIQCRLPAVEAGKVVPRIEWERFIERRLLLQGLLLDLNDGLGRMIRMN